MIGFDDMLRLHCEAVHGSHRPLMPPRCACGREFKTLREMFRCEENGHGRRSTDE